MIGKLSTSSDRCLVFDLVPTPPNDAGEPACSLVEADKKKGSKGKSQSDSSSSSLFIDKDWVAEHARQVQQAPLFRPTSAATFRILFRVYFLLVPLLLIISSKTNI